MCEDYRAGLGIDPDHDAEDRAAGRRITRPTLLLESAHDDLDIQEDATEIWAPWLDCPLQHRIIDSGHHQAEQAPDTVARAILDLLNAHA
jgi:haloacetate dehalogenase